MHASDSACVIKSHCLIGLCSVYYSYEAATGQILADSLQTFALKVVWGVYVESGMTEFEDWIQLPFTTKFRLTLTILVIFDLCVRLIVANSALSAY